MSKNGSRENQNRTRRGSRKQEELNQKTFGRAARREPGSNQKRTRKQPEESKNGSGENQNRTRRGSRKQEELNQKTFGRAARREPGSNQKRTRKHELIIVQWVRRTQLLSWIAMVSV